MATNNNINYGPAALPGTVPTPVLGNNIDRAPAPVDPGVGTGYVPTVTRPVVPVTEQPVINPPIVVARTAVVIPVAEQPVAEVVAESTTGPNITASNQQRYITILANGAVITSDASTLDFEGSGFTITSSGVNGAIISINAEAGGYGNSNVVSFLAGFGSNTLSTTGNVTGGYILGNGSQLTGIAATYGNANVVANLTALGSNPVSTTGNVTAGNLNSPTLNNSGNISVVASGNTWTFGANGSLTLPIGVSINYIGNVQYPKIIADSGKLFSVQGQGNTGSAALAWTVDPNAASQYAAVSVSRAGGDDLAKVVLQAQSDSGNVATAKTWQFSETGNLTLPGNLIIVGNTSVFGTDAALITPAPDLPLIALSAGANGSVSSLWIEDPFNVGTSNIAAVYANPTSGSKIVRIAVGQNGGGGPNLWDFGANGNLTVPGGGSILGGANVNATTHTGTTVSVSANITGGNLLTGGLISATGNVSGGNLNATRLSLSGNVVSALVSAANITTTANISGNYILGNGSQLTSINAVTVDITDTNGLTTVYYPTFVENRTTAQIARADVDLTYRTDDNLLTVGNVSVTGNVSGGNLLTGGLISATSTITSAANVTGGNVLTGGVISATANITGGNVLTGGLISATANITGGNVITAGLTSTASLSITGNTATVTTANYSIGYLNVPQVSLSSNSTVALTDSGKHYYSVSASNLALTIANNTSVSWSVGTAITIVNAGTANILINQGTGVSMYQAGNATSGNRVLATFGMATIMNTAANVWFINGTGLT